MTVVNVPMQFLSRYSVVCRSTPYTSFQYCSIYIFSTLYVGAHAGLMYLTFDYEGNSTKMDYYEAILKENKMFAGNESLPFVVGDAVSL